MEQLKSRIACGKNKVFGVTEEGKILVTGVAEGAVTPISHWENIAAISVGGQVVGLKKDGTVIVSGDNRDGQGDTDSWENIVAIAAGSWHTVGLKADGTVVAVGGNREGQCNVDRYHRHRSRRRAYRWSEKGRHCGCHRREFLDPVRRGKLDGYRGH